SSRTASRAATPTAGPTTTRARRRASRSARRRATKRARRPRATCRSRSAARRRSPCSDRSPRAMLADFEKLGAFYLGREGDRAFLYDAKHLTTHAVVIGMTGSGKTGLSIALLEEAAIDGIPAIVVDPKGDLGNLLLTFPKLAAEEFAPWVPAGADAA